MTVFEDDGDTGYFYALEVSREESIKIVDAVQIYRAQEEYGEVGESLVRIVWSPDGSKSALALDGELQAVFDFMARVGCCRSGFPPATGWRRTRARSVDLLAELFAAKAVQH